MHPKNMAMYLTYKKELGPCPENWAVVRILKWLPKSAKTAIFKNRGFLRNPADRTKIALDRPIFKQMTPNLLHLKGMSNICVIVAQNRTLSFILGPKIGPKSKIPNFEILHFSGGPTLPAPGPDPKKFLNPKTVLLYSICPNLTLDTT